MRNIVRGLCLALVAAALVAGIGAPADAGKVPEAVTQATDTLKCKNGTEYTADPPSTFAWDCYIKHKGLGYEGKGRTDMVLFKTKAEGKAFWSDRLAGCGECYIVRKGKLWIASASGYEQDVAEYVHDKLGGKLFHY